MGKKWVSWAFLGTSVFLMCCLLFSVKNNLESADLYLADNRNLVIALSQKSAEIEKQRIKIENLERILSRFL